MSRVWDILPFVVVAVWVLFIAPKFPRAESVVDRAMYFIVPVVALIGTIYAWGHGGYHVLWGVLFGVLISFRFDDFMDWRYRGISPFKEAGK